MDSSRTIGLYFDSALPSSSLLAFPIVLQATGDGKKQITPQYRIQRLDSWTDSREDSVFITTYGFIFQVGNEEVTVGTINDNPRQELLSSAMLCLGSVPNDGDLVELARACLTMVVTCKKSATNTERIVFSIVQAPRVLQSCMVVANRYSSVNAVKHVKAPEKIPGSGTLEYKVNFVSLTVVPRKDVYRIPTAALKVSGSSLYNLALNVTIDVEVAPNSPLVKSLSKSDSGYYANLFLHIGLMSTVDKKGKKVTFDKLEEKIRRLNLSVGLSDVLGPSVLVKARGARTKLLAPFFSSSGTACYPIANASPQVAKILWSQTAHLRSVKVIIQAGTQRAVAVTTDHEVTSTKIEKRHTIAKYNPFKK
uniref:Matrix protein n=1 Tax=Avian paramyxovirus 1 TaxID=2560319 RepID=H6VTC1_NCDV|nr:matrix [avian paramyxovirus 1]AEZ01009.1 matrix [avian paramyxovirus 1]AEZ36128.1 matrix [avian paramyxovirus 1]AHV78499.1 matrix protein [avian paramyxovirus 1]AWU46607.1 matrix protein [avian paramyxovirus 1]